MRCDVCQLPGMLRSALQLVSRRNVGVTRLFGAVLQEPGPPGELVATSNGEKRCLCAVVQAISVC